MGIFAVGNMRIRLGVGLSDFQKELADANSSVTRETRKMSATMREQSQEARASMMLLGETIGVHIPRHLQTLLAKIPAIGLAFSSVLGVAAFGAVIEVISKIVEKLDQWEKKAQELAAEWDKVREHVKDALEKSEEKLLESGKKIDELRKNHVAALAKELQLIDLQSLAEIRKEFDELATSIDAVTKKDLDRNSWWYFLTTGESLEAVKAANAELQNFKKSFNELSRTSTVPIATAALTDEINKIKAKIAELAEQNPSPYLTDEQKEWARILELVQGYSRAQVDRNIAWQNDKAVPVLKDQQRAQEEVLKAQKEQIEAEKFLDGLYKGLKPPSADPIVNVQEKTKDAITKLKEYAEEHKKVWSDYRVLLEQTKLQALGLEAQLAVIVKEAEKLHSELRLPTPLPEVALPPATPTKGKTAGEKELEAITPKPNATYEETIKQEEAAEKAAQKIRDAVESENQKYREQLAILEQLHKSHLLTDEEYKKAKEQLSGQAQVWRELGANITQTIEQAALFGRSWTDALKAILIELAQVLIKLTLMKQAQTGAAGANNSGILGSLLGGIFGGFRAEGGPVLPEHSYIINEKLGGEVFTPDRPGYVMPQVPTSSSGGRAIYVTNHFLFPDNTNKDEFMKSTGQVGNAVHRSISIAAARNS